MLNWRYIKLPLSFERLLAASACHSDLVHSVWTLWRSERPIFEAIHMIVTDMTVFWYVRLSNTPWRWRQYVLPKRRSIPTRQVSVKTKFYSCPQPVIEPRNLGRPSRGLVTVLTELFTLLPSGQGSASPLVIPWPPPSVRFCHPNVSKRISPHDNLTSQLLILLQTCQPTTVMLCSLKTYEQAQEKRSLCTALRHNEGGDRGTTPRIHNLPTRWRWTVKLRPPAGNYSKE